MGILRSKMIDLSQPHLIPERMRSFMVEYFDYLAAGTPEIRDLDSLESKFGSNLLYTPIDADFQSNSLRMAVINHLHVPFFCDFLFSVITWNKANDKSDVYSTNPGRGLLLSDEGKR